MFFFSLSTLHMKHRQTVKQMVRTHACTHTHTLMDAHSMDNLPLHTHSGLRSLEGKSYVWQGFLERKITNGQTYGQILVMLTNPPIPHNICAFVYGVCRGDIKCTPHYTWQELCHATAVRKVHMIFNGKKTLAFCEVRLPVLYITDTFYTGCQLTNFTKFLMRFCHLNLHFTTTVFLPIINKT